MPDENHLNIPPHLAAKLNDPRNYVTFTQDDLEEIRATITGLQRLARIGLDYLCRDDDGPAQTSYLSGKLECLTPAPDR